MSLSILSIVPTTPAELATFAFSNADEHFKLGHAIQRQFGVNLAIRPLDPLPLDNEYALLAWLRNHQQMHADIDRLLGIGTPDLSIIDFRDQQEVSAWIALHLAQHQTEAQMTHLP